MKFLIFDCEAMACALAWKLKLEGNDVRILSQKPDGREHLNGMVTPVRSLAEGLAWVGKDGRIICGDEQDVTPIRKRGFRVYGGNAVTSRIESDRSFENLVARSCGIKTPNCHHIGSVDEGIRFIRSHPDRYALKQEGDAPKTWNYVGKADDGSDVIDQLEWMKGTKEFAKFRARCPFMLQECVEGLEFAVSGWWMGKDWKRTNDGAPLCEVNREHKKSLDGDLGMTCGEAGTVMRFSDNLKLFNATLAKLTPFLQKHCPDVVVNIDANCGIVEETGEPFLFELTPREGYPSQALILHLLRADAGDFFSGLIEGEMGGVEVKPYWGVVVVMGSGNYPRECPPGMTHGSLRGQPVIIPQWDKTIDEHIHPFYLRYDPAKDFFRVADNYEWLLGVTHCEEDIADANRQCVEDLEKIVTRAPVYRHDIGEKFQNEELPKLKSLGYID